MRTDDTLKNNPHISREALQEIHDQLFAWAMSRCDFDRVAAEDMMQQTYVEVLSGRARFDNQSTLRTFLFGVVQKLASGMRRKLAIRLRIVSQHPGQFSQTEALESNQGDIESERVWQAVANLPARQRDITELVFCRDITIEEASTIMGISVGTGRVHYDRAKKALAVSLASIQ